MSAPLVNGPDARERRITAPGVSTVTTAGVREAPTIGSEVRVLMPGQVTAIRGFDMARVAWLVEIEGVPTPRLVRVDPTTGVWAEMPGGESAVKLSR